MLQAAAQFRERGEAVVRLCPERRGIHAQSSGGFAEDDQILNYTDPKSPSMIITVRGDGYMFTPEVEVA